MTAGNEVLVERRPIISARLTITLASDCSTTLLHLPLSFPPLSFPPPLFFFLPPKSWGIWKQSRRWVVQVLGDYMRRGENGGTLPMRRQDRWLFCFSFLSFSPFFFSFLFSGVSPVHLCACSSIAEGRDDRLSID